MPGDDVYSFNKRLNNCLFSSDNIMNSLNVGVCSVKESVDKCIPSCYFYKDSKCLLQ